MLRTFGLFICLSTLVGTGCASDPVALLPTCAGDGCSCETDTCVCVAGTDCVASCARDCGLTCSAESTCESKAVGAVEMECLDDATCKGNGGALSVILCSGTSDCDLKADENSVAVCRDQAVCKFNLGAGSTARCLDTADCDIKCDDGDCDVACGKNAMCNLNCSEQVVTTCDDGRLVCGDC